VTVAEAMTAAEARFEARRQLAGLVLAPLAFVVLLVSPLPLDRPAHALAAVAAATVILASSLPSSDVAGTHPPSPGHRYRSC
jgi:hypothetical protein